MPTAGRDLPARVTPGRSRPREAVPPRPVTRPTTHATPTPTAGRRARRATGRRRADTGQLPEERSTVDITNVQHSPMGAHASFTLGHPGPHGGLGLGLSGPAGQNVYIAVEDAPGAGTYSALPFFAADQDDDPLARFQGGEGARPTAATALLTPLPADRIRRTFDAVTDRWTAGPLDFAVHSPLGDLPEPPRAAPGAAPHGTPGPVDEALRRAVLPAVLAELTIDNSAGTAPLRAVVGYAGTDPYSGMRHLDGPGLTGIGEGVRTAIVTDAPDARTAIGFDIPFILGDRQGQGAGFGLGQTGLLVLDVPAGEIRTHRLAFCFHTAEQVTAPERCRYLYNRFYPDLESVAATALAGYDSLLAGWRRAADDLGAASLGEDRAFMLALAVRSYYGSTELLEDAEGRPVWIVNEGEYRMMNTLDLTVDHSFFEVRQHPWTLRDVLDRQLADYSYTDRFGLSFTHDMGVANVWSPHGTSSYEKPGLSDCFSYMTGEQLLNWVLAAAVYAGTGDAAWCAARADALRACLDSMLARDPGAAGVQTEDSDLVGRGAEITTYDSLDTSLGQARSSTYMAVKGWAAYRWLERTLRGFGDTAAAEEAGFRAGRAVKTLLAAVGPDGTLPALLDEPDGARIIPVVEGLALARLTGTDVHSEPQLVAVLRDHLHGVLDSGRCRFPDGGWKLSETSDNSWLSKIYLCQFVARDLLGLPDDEAMAAADRAHAEWLRHPTESRWSWSDQMIAGVAAGSRYYPRGVTAVTWLLEGGAV
ncbi:glycoside hydrolase family 52 protein [Kitasatospora indigofera]|uniref:glycoside hydrolase family 52 protein n=1 Tax=Kitasatospora indigofera TaxID=67307 RepID=UPI00369BF72B